MTRPLVQLPLGHCECDRCVEYLAKLHGISVEDARKFVERRGFELIELESVMGG